MFGISFSELFVIGIVALIVIGPEKLPKVARTVGALMGRMQRYATQVKEEVNREFRFEELQKLQEEIKQAVINTEQNVHQQAAEIENSIAGLNETKVPLSQNFIQKPKTVRKPRAKSVKEDVNSLNKVPEKALKASAELARSSSLSEVGKSKKPIKKVES